MGLIDPKITVETGNVWGIGAGVVFLIGAIVTGITKVITRNHISKDEAYKKLQNKDFCDERFTGLKTHIDTRFEDMKDFIRKNGK